MLTSCSTCGAIHQRGTTCPKKPKRKNRNNDTASQIRRTAKWNKKRQQIKADAGNLCEYCLTQGRLTYARLEIHHITPIRQAPEEAYEDINLICLCHTCHTLAEKENIPKDILIAIAQQRTTQDNTPPP